MRDLRCEAAARHQAVEPVALDGVSRDHRAPGTSMSEAKENHFLISGVVAIRNLQPYIQLLINGELMFQWHITEARSIAWDILRMCSRTEADAMIVKFFGKMDFPDGALAALMQEFRDYRHELDMIDVDKSDYDPEAGDGTAI
jgi:hypothetical protein